MHHVFAVTVLGCYEKEPKVRESGEIFLAYLTAPDGIYWHWKLFPLDSDPSIPA